MQEWPGQLFQLQGTIVPFSVISQSDKKKKNPHGFLILYFSRYCSSDFLLHLYLKLPLFMFLLSLPCPIRFALQKFSLGAIHVLPWKQALVGQFHEVLGSILVQYHLLLLHSPTSHSQDCTYCIVHLHLPTNWLLENAFLFLAAVLWTPQFQ